MAARLSGERTRGRPVNVENNAHSARFSTFTAVDEQYVRCALAILKSPWSRELEDADPEASKLVG